MPQRERIRIYSIDITKRVNAENKLLELNRKLEETVNERTQELNRLNQELELDLVSRKNSEIALEAERKRFNDVLEVLPVYIILLDSRRSHKLRKQIFLGLPFASQVMFDVMNLQNYRDKPQEVSATFKPLQSGQPNIWDWVGPENRIYNVHDYSFTDVDGSPLILEMGLDITEIRKLREKLLETANYNRSLIEANLDFLVTINQDGIIGDVNTAAEIATGLSREELIGSRFETHFENAEAANRGIQLGFGGQAVFGIMNWNSSIKMVIQPQ